MRLRCRIALVGSGLGIVALCLAPRAEAQQCPEMVEKRHHTDSYRGAWGEPFRVLSESQYLFVIHQHSFRSCGIKPPQPISCRTVHPWYLATVDISDPTGPRILDNVPLGWRPRDVAASGNRVYTLNRGLTIVDISDPRNPVLLLGSLDYDGTASEIAAAGDYVFIAVGHGLMILDATDPAHPFEVGFFSSQWDPSDLVIDGKYAYVASSNQGLRIVDISDPTRPFEAGSFQAPWTAHDLEVSEGRAYLADADEGLHIIDVSSTSTPVLLGSVETPGTAWSVSVAQSIAIVSLGSRGLWIVDLSNPSLPQHIATYDTRGAAWDAKLVGDHIYVADGHGSNTPPQIRLGDGPFSGGLRVLEHSIAGWPGEIASVDFLAPAIDVFANEDVLCVARGDLGIWVQDQKHQGVFGWLDTPGVAQGVTVHGDLALVADDHKGVRIVDASDPANLVEIGFIDTPGHAHRIAADGDLAYVADGDAGLRIINISWPAEPYEVGSVDTPGQALDISISNGYAYVADGEGGLRIIDVSDPSHPVEVGAPEYVASATGVAVSSEIAFVVSRERWGPPVLNALDVSDPTSPRPALEDPPCCSTEGFYFALQGEGTGISVADGFVFVSTRGIDGVEVIDISKPGRPAGSGAWLASRDGLGGRSGEYGGVLGLSESHGEIYLAYDLEGVPVLDSRCLTTYWVDIVAHQQGYNGSNWRSDVIISQKPWGSDSLSNTKSSDEVAIELILHTPDGVFTRKAAVGRNGQGVFEDVVGLFDYVGKGILEIRSESRSNVSSRDYNQVDSGTLGTFHMGYRGSDCLGKYESAYLFGLRQEEGKYRTNINISNAGPLESWVGITLYRSDGSELLDYGLSVQPGEVIQDLQPFKNRAGQLNLGWGFAKVWAGNNPETRILVSASVIDTRTNNAVMIPMTK